MTLEEEKREYNEFMAKLYKKKYELQYDFANLSYNNKIRVISFVNHLFVAGNLNALVNYFRKV